MERLTGDAAETSASSGRVPTFSSSPSLRRSISAPQLAGPDAQCLSGTGMEVYVVQRPFASFGAAMFKRLPPSVNQLLQDIGVCHFMVVYRQPTGRLVQYDFGPVGRDISLGPADQGRLARLLGRRSRAVPAEIRETRLTALPESCLYVGRTNMTLRQVQAFNEAQRMEYEVHLNDCRHYVDRVVRYTTGSERAAAAAARHSYRVRRQKWRWTSGLTLLTNAEYYTHLKTMSQASVALAAMLTNKGKVTRMLGRKVVVPHTTALVPVPAKLMLRRRVLPTAGAATAGVVVARWTDAPVLRSVLSLGEGVKRAASRGVMWMGDMARGAGSSVASSNRQKLVRLPFRRRHTPQLAMSGQ